MKLISGPALSRRAIVALLVGVLALGAAVGTLASQDALPVVQSGDGPAAQTDDDAVELQDATRDGATEGGNSNGGDQDGTGQDDGATEEEDGQRDVVGVPEDNPNHQPDDDGECEKGETVIKTTPSGRQVRVPCHAVEPGPPGFGRADGGGNEETTGKGDGGRDVVGIPEDNPNHQPDDDGECEKGETAIKTTPGGRQVRVPCHSVEPGPPGFSHGHQGDDGQPEDEG